MAPARSKKTASRTQEKKKTAAAKSAAKKQPAKKQPAKKQPAKKSTPKRATTKSTPPKKSAPRRKAASASDSVDEQRAPSRSMRALKVTAAPSGVNRSSSSPPYAPRIVIQTPAASHLH